MDNIDITSNRHGGNEESTKASKDGNKKQDRNIVLGLIRAAGAEGMTLDEVSIAMGRAPNALSGRVSELKRDGYIIPNGQRRITRTKSTAAVLIINPNAPGTDA